MTPDRLTATLDAFDGALAGATGTIDFEIRDDRAPLTLLSKIECSQHQRLQAATLLPGVVEALAALVAGATFARFFYSAEATRPPPWR